MSYQNVKNSRAKLKERAVYALGGECQCCGYSKCISALEFHHSNPKEKDFSISKITNRNWADVKEELKKCILVCANCHREIHYGFINNEELISSFNETKAKEIDEIIRRQKEGEIFHCEKCGTIIPKWLTLCKQCKLESLNRKEKPEREILKNLIRSTPFTKIGEMYGVTDNAVRRWCDSYNLPRKAREIKQISEAEWEKI